MKKIFYSATLIFLTQWVSAQVLVNNDLKNLITQSFTYFPKVRETENTVSTAQERLEIASINNPIVDGNASYNFVEPKITLPIDGKEFQFAPVHNGNVNISASYTLFDFGRLKSNVEKAKVDLQYAQHSVDNVKADLANQVAIIYYNIVFFKRAISIQDSVLNYLNENKKIVDSKLKNGDAIKIDLLNIQADIDAAQNRKIDFQNSLQRQQNLLAYTTGQMQEHGKAFDFDVAMRDTLAILNEAQNNNIDYVLAKDKIKQALSEVGIAKTGDKPSINIGGNTGSKMDMFPM
jgi:outer membrane protein TolC